MSVLFLCAVYLCNVVNHTKKENVQIYTFSFFVVYCELVFFFKFCLFLLQVVFA